MAEEKVYKFTDPTKPAKSLIVMLKIMLVLTLLSIVGGGYSLHVLTKIKKQSFATQAAMEEAANCSDMINGTIGGWANLLNLIIIIFFIRWMYRAAANNHAWKIENITQKPHWGWINFVIPFWCVVKPYEFFSEIWNAVEYDKEKPEDWKKLYAPRSLKIWWACFLISGILSRILLRSGMNDESLNGLITSIWVAMISSFIDIAMYLALIKFIAGVMKRQIQYSQKVAEQNSEAAISNAQ